MQTNRRIATPFAALPSGNRVAGEERDGLAEGPRHVPLSDRPKVRYARCQASRAWPGRDDGASSVQRSGTFSEIQARAHAGILPVLSAIEDPDQAADVLDKAFADAARPWACPGNPEEILRSDRQKST
jgi:hypothetical protein